MRQSISQTDPFVKIATIGLAALVGLQAMINMAVNVALLPAKGMTLPFISYGGSSLLSVAFAMGLVLSLTRRRPLGGAPAPRWDGRIAAAG
jgi:cell division protein FtsW